MARPPRGPALLPPGSAAALEIATPPRASRLLLLLLLPFLGAACGGPPWTQGQIDEAYRLCRAEIGFPPISVFETSGTGYASFMCRCEVEYLSDRVRQADFRSGLYLDKVNRVLSAGRTACMVRHRDGER